MPFFGRRHETSLVVHELEALGSVGDLGVGHVHAGGSTVGAVLERLEQRLEEIEARESVELRLAPVN